MHSGLNLYQLGPFFIIQFFHTSEMGTTNSRLFNLPSDKVVLIVKSLPLFGGFGAKVMSTIFP